MPEKSTKQPEKSTKQPEKSTKQPENNYEIIAFYNDEGKRYFKVGKKVDDSLPLTDENVEWKLDKNGKPIKVDEYKEAEKLCK